MRQTRTWLVSVVSLAMAAMFGGTAVAQGEPPPLPDRIQRGGDGARWSPPAAQHGADDITLQSHGVTVRIAGADRIGTSIAASQFLYADADDPNPDAFKADAVIVSRSDNYADALGGAALAAAVNAPLFLTPTSTLRSDVEAEIDRIVNAGTTVYILGGPGAVAPAVEARLDSLGYSTVRLAGVDRFATSVEIAEEIDSIYAGVGGLGIAFVTTGLNFPDGLAAGTTAGAYGGAVLLTSNSAVPASVQTFLNSHDTVFRAAVGGQAANAPIAYDSELVGVDRYDTAAFVAEVFFGDPTVPEDDPIAIGLATGVDWPDALSGGAMISGFGPLVLTRTNDLPAVTADVVEHLVTQTDGTTPADVALGAVFGGTAVVGTTPYSQFEQLIALG